MDKLTRKAGLWDCAEAMLNRMMNLWTPAEKTQLTTIAASDQGTTHTAEVTTINWVLARGVGGVVSGQRSGQGAGGRLPRDGNQPNPNRTTTIKQPPDKTTPQDPHLKRLRGVVEEELARLEELTGRPLEIRDLDGEVQGFSVPASQLAFEKDSGALSLARTAFRVRAPGGAVGKITNLCFPTYLRF